MVLELHALNVHKAYLTKLGLAQVRHLLLINIACNNNPLNPIGVYCDQALTTATNTVWTRCKDAYADSTGKCVTNCGPGKYGQADMFTTNGEPRVSKCYNCIAPCTQCIGGANNQCTACSAGFYLSVVGSSPVTYGSCVSKLGSSTSLEVFVRSFSGWTTWPIPQATLQTYGTLGSPFLSLVDGLAKAYELGAQYTSATVTIWLLGSTGSNVN